ncbi:MAG: DUF4097 family beta strand repeat-containing protein [Gemmatimonadaceae bacterium]
MRLSFSLFPVLALPALSALMAPLTVAAQQKVEIHRAAAPNVSVRIGGAFSSLKVSAWPSDSIALTGAVGVGSRLDGGSINRTGPVTGMKFFVIATENASIAGNRLELRVPRGARVWAKAGSADIEVNGVAGGLDLNIIGGSVRVTGKPTELIIESMDGSVSFTGFTDYARVKTATGDITLFGGGEDLSFSTVSGNINGSNGERTIARARFESVTGSITFAGDLPRGADLRFDTHSGPIALRLASSRVDIDAMTHTGAIENAWSSERPIAGREGRGMELGVSSAGSSARVSIRSFKGNVSIRP